MNILAIDYGAKNIGLAWINTDVGVVLPYGRVQRSAFSVQRFIELIEKEKIDQIVVGLPLGLDGKENENVKKVRGFIAELKAASGLPIAEVDERFTSAQADRMEGGEAQTGASRDEKSAMIILQAYLERVEGLG